MIEDNIPADDDEVHAQESDAELNRYDNIDADSRGF